ncbi:MAG TPA: GDSL-type esterase/lipase family protein [Gemmataceae bacterium]|nr:GDSL-type esterase/lipase family protein [Gemmataceae bacterium]
MLKRIPFVAAVALLTIWPAVRADDKAVAFPFKDGDRVAWIGSSSTNIGVWPRTMEFLLRTRNPDVHLTFHKFSTGGGTFATGAEKLDGWLADFKPTLVFLNYGGNDAAAGEAGLPQFKENMEKCVAKVEAAGARVVLVTPQAADVRKSGEEAAANRRLYAETMLAFAKEKGWPVVDTHHPLETLQREGEKADKDFTINKDKIHLTDPGYVAWGCFLYERLTPPACECKAVLTADGKTTATTRCKVEDVKAEAGTLSFVRRDEVLPILPPAALLPPRGPVPLEKLSPYLLAVTGLPDGNYEILCEDKPIGEATASRLAEGVNLNTLLLDSGKPAPWAELAEQLWAGKGLDQIGATRWRFAVRKK